MQVLYNIFFTISHYISIFQYKNNLEPLVCADRRLTKRLDKKPQHLKYYLRMAVGNMFGVKVMR